MKPLALVFSLAALALHVSAEDLKLSDGTVLRDAAIAKSDAVTVRITHADGIAVVKAADLPTDWQQRVGYDPERTAAAVKAAAEQAQAAAGAKAKAAQFRAECSSLRGRVVRISDAGVLVQCGYKFYLNNSDQTDGLDLPSVDGTVLLRGHPEQATLVDNAIVGVIAKRDPQPFRAGGMTLASFTFVSSATDGSRGVTSGPATSAAVKGGDLIISPDGAGGATVRQLPSGVSRLQSIGGAASR